MKILNKKIKHDGFLKVWETQMENDKGESFTREVMYRPDAVAAVVVNSLTQKVILVSQYRPGSESELVELVAGTIEKGQSPEETIIREIQEETGYETDSVELIETFYVSPGANTEKIYLFLCIVSKKTGEGGGLAEEHEDIRIIETPMNDFVNGSYQDAKTIIGALWLKKQL